MPVEPTTHAAASPNGSVTDSTTQPIIRLVHLRKSFHWTPVLRGLSAEFAHGKTTVVLGPSGCGKSVMLKHIVGLLKPDLGEVWYENTRIDTLTEARLGPIRKEIGFLFQQGALFDSMSVRQNIEFPLLEHTKMPADEREHKINQVLGMVGLQEVINKMPADLSGGQKKRVALARAIVLEPKVVLYDEPTTGLDPIRADVINELIIKLQSELHLTSIAVTHDLNSAFKIAGYMMMMHEGKVVFHGTPDELRDSGDPVVQRFLRGEATADELAGINMVKR